VRQPGYTLPEYSTWTPASRAGTTASFTRRGSLSLTSPLGRVLHLAQRHVLVGRPLRWRRRVGDRDELRNRLRAGDRGSTRRLYKPVTSVAAPSSNTVRRSSRSPTPSSPTSVARPARALSQVQYSAQPVDVQGQEPRRGEGRGRSLARDAGVQVEYFRSVYRAGAPRSPRRRRSSACSSRSSSDDHRSVRSRSPPDCRSLDGDHRPSGDAHRASPPSRRCINIASASTTGRADARLSCGIDYGLFIRVPNRNNLLTGMTVEDSVALAVVTAGSSVVFPADR